MNTTGENEIQKDTECAEAEKEVFALDRDRIRELSGESSLPVADVAKEYLTFGAKMLESFLEEYEFVADGGLHTCSMEELERRNHNLYEDILPEHYDVSFANPVYCSERFGKEYGPLAAALIYELRSVIPFVYEGLWSEIRIRVELFLEVYTAFEVEWQQYRTLLESGKDPSEFGILGIPAARTLKKILYSYVSDYLEQETALNIQRKLVGETGTGEAAGSRRPRDYALGLFADAAMFDLSSPRYLYAFGEYITENELRTHRHLEELSEDEIRKMADTWTEGFRIGFENSGKDLSAKRSVSLLWQLGFERVILCAVRNLEALGKKVICYRETEGLFGLHSSEPAGYHGSDANPQYRYDHREDLALILDEQLANRMSEALQTGYRLWHEDTVLYAGPAVMEVFGEPAFLPKSGEGKPSYDERQQKLIARYRQNASRQYNEAVIGSNRSFTIIAFPLPSIEKGNPKGASYEEIFEAVMEINTLDYMTYQRIQGKLIDALNLADSLHIVGKNGNPTDLTVNLWKLQNPEQEAIFENCVADVNIPVGEVFTSPVLEGTNGLLWVSRVYLEGICFKNLALTFQNGRVVEYSCSNHEGEENADEKGKRLIEENILFHHENLPMGECAIGTNTTAYAAGIRYGIADRLPILIAEKTGPHFAVGDTCYSDDEDNISCNPDGKRIVARENEVSKLRRTNPEKAYYGCHTDITIPFAELGKIEAIHSDGSRVILLENGRFVLPGTQELNLPLEKLEEQQL